MKSSTKVEVAKAVGLGIAMGNLDAGAVSGWLHRSYTHKQYKLATPIEKAARTIVWMTGTVPRVYATIHRRHHKFADKPGDPHSPVLLGRYGVAKLFFKNTWMYHEETKEASKGPFAPDLQPDRLDEAIFDKQNAGMLASLGVHVAANKMIGNRARMAAISFLIEKAYYVKAGDAVNAIGHGGKHPFRALITGKIEPHEDNTYGADSRLVAFLTGGEGNQREHHEDEKKPFFGPDPESLTWRQRAARDLVGTAAIALMDIGLAERGTEPPDTLAA